MEAVQRSVRQDVIIQSAACIVASLVFLAKRSVQTNVFIKNAQKIVQKYVIFLDAKEDVMKKLKNVVINVLEYVEVTV